MNCPRNISIVIPTFGREEVLIETLRLVLALGPDEILVIDQTPAHEKAVQLQLEEWSRAGTIRLIRLDRPSISHAMNLGLVSARNDVVLFLDDDIIPSEKLLPAHLAAHASHPEATAVVGQVLQPGESPTSCPDRFQFNSDAPAWIESAMAGNLSVDRQAAIAAGGFDENFVGVAYQFETEFALRLIRNGGKVYYEPSATIRHLRAARGGTRSFGSHLRTLSPAHAVGDYYFLFLTQKNMSYATRALARLRSSLLNRHHLEHPWWIPLTFIAEIRGFLLAKKLFQSGQKFINPEALARELTQ